TIHVGKADFYPLPSIIEDSFKTADTLIEEIDTSDPAEAARIEQGLAAVGAYTNGDTINNHLSEVTRSHLATYVKNGGLPEAAIAPMRPGLLSMLLVQFGIKRRGGRPAHPSYQHFLTEARQSPKEIGALEDAASQLRLLSSLSEEFQDRLLLNSLVDMEKWVDTFDLLTRAWQSGDAAAMQEVITSSSVRDFPQL